MFMSPKRLAPLAGVIALSLGSFAAVAQDAEAPAETPAETPAEAPAAPAEPAETASPDTVVATIGDQTITEADLSFAAEDLTQELAQMPPAERRPFLLRVLIDMKVMAGAAREAGMGDTPLFQQRLDYLEDRALRRAYFADVIAAAVTPEAVQARYDELVADFEPEDEIRARHILVETEEEAQAVKEELEGGADFAELAAEKSIDPGAANGGDLGFFSRGMMVEPFEEAAFALTEVGQISDPVQSQFGWHVIKLEERRESSPPSIEQVGQQIQQQVLMTAFDDAVEELMADVEVDIADPELKAAVEAQQAAEEAAAAAADEAAPAQDAEAAPAEDAAPAEEAPAEEAAPAQ